MKDKIIVILSVTFGITCLLFASLWIVIAKDLGERVNEQEQEIIQLRWENENNYMYCEVE